MNYADLNEDIKGAVEGNTWEQNLSYFLGCAGYALFSGWVAIIYFSPILFVGSNHENSVIVFARIVYLIVLLITQIILWIASSYLSEKSIIVFILGSALSVFSGLQLLLGDIGSSLAFFTCWAIAGIGHSCLVVLWGRFLASLKRKFAAYCIAMATFVSGVVFLVVSFLQTSVLFVAIIALPVISLGFYLLANNNHSFIKIMVAKPKSALNRITWKPYAATFLYSIPAGIAGAYLVVSSFSPMIIALVVSFSALIAGFVMFVTTTNPLFQRFTAEWALPIMLLSLVLIPFVEGVAALVAYTCTISFFFFRSISNRRAVSAILSSAKGYVIGLNAFGHTANAGGMLLGWALASTGILSGDATIELICFCLAIAFLIIAGSFFLADYYPKKKVSEEEGSGGRWRTSCCSVAAAFGLTPRQEEVMIMLAKGYNARAIEESLFLSSHTVRSHTQEIYKKLDIHSKQELLDIIDNAVLISMKSKD